MAKISVNHLQKNFHGHPILSDVSFSVESGRIVALLGGSGAGKSTLLRCLNLLEQPNGGVIELGSFGIDFSNPKLKIAEQQQRTLRSQIGMVFQQFNLWPHLTVLGNLIEAPMQVLKNSKDNAINEAKTLLRQVGLADKSDRYPHQLSGGQQQRVAIARALMMHPKIMLFDEPTSALDPKTVSELVLLIKTLAVKGMTMIIATHEMNFARRVADQIIFLDQGHIVEQGATAELFLNPKTAAFAQFIEGIP